MSPPSPTDHVWWLASRASGVVALALVTTSVWLGLAMAAKLGRRRKGLGRSMTAVHEQLAVCGLMATAMHGLTLLGDPWLHPGLRGIALPFAGTYRPLYTGLGIIGGYLAALLGLSFYVRRRIGARLWRKLHRFTTAVWVLALVHTLGAGTDAGSPWLRLALLATAVPVLPLLALRLVRGGAKKRRRASGRARGEKLAGELA